ncbi:hypothetical protein OVS_04005 [Mycoplasma ovis str. Michigan]|uniref:Uncharacterized protein n=1 Tax=Mycoplasma ovis str. Michigan TaxID=1415773 RepID=A0ABN4BRQ7_9MOLU|nr:hypothetical protein [Mycoplasma ovis]AHC40532.1 hypothetical protein OVS_04005 [Mycoplasma ovis str. Michigan]
MASFVSLLSKYLLSAIGAGSGVVGTIFGTINAGKTQGEITHQVEEQRPTGSDVVSRTPSVIVFPQTPVESTGPAISAESDRSGEGVDATGKKKTEAEPKKEVKEQSDNRNLHAETLRGTGGTKQISEQSPSIVGEGTTLQKPNLESQLNIPESRNESELASSVSEISPQPLALPEDSASESESRETSGLRGSRFTMRSKNYDGLEQTELMPDECTRNIDVDRVSFSCPTNDDIGLKTNIDFSFLTKSVPSLQDKDWNDLSESTIYPRMDNITVGLIFNSGGGEIEVPLEAPEKYLKLMGYEG